ncbi:Beta-galactosidase bgaB [Pontiella desulfatans]|uniref:beta-galactosidase n=1 Tax=Pontiella desulfatans TaxID=2750659 RepID=A0A6C2U1X5_PONDE|nr:beta-galactosidase [Pontiella desulfatans]VGO13654.1 Beta-galactosidase bgaB [Pontiella desulfatans]
MLHPYLNHPEAKQARMHFLETTVKRYAEHPAMGMWDAWNEPEQNFVNRAPTPDKLTCFCPHCLAGFIKELKTKYGTIQALNTVWGRCYESWDEVEAPRNAQTIKDFIDFRRYQLGVMEREAQARLDCVRANDPNHPAYLHVVPNTMRIFNSVTGVDDFAMAEPCDLFASTSNGGPIWPNQLISAGRGKTCYNVESHLNAGQISLHQKPLELGDVLSDLLPQIGTGVKGFLFWQYRPEVLGTEAPAWGLVRPDGSDRPVTRAVHQFGEALAPIMQQLTECKPEPAQVAIWKSTRNELFEFCARGDLSRLADHVEGYRVWFRKHNIATININDILLKQGALDGIRLLVMPACYCLSEAEANALDQWVRAGGTLLCEAHLGAWNETAGRHERSVPGCGLAAKWNLHETDSCASLHLSDAVGEHMAGGINPDVAKALGEESGGLYFPIQFNSGETLLGSDTFAELTNGDWTPLATHDGKTVIATRSIGSGTVIYCGTNLGGALEQSPQGANALLARVLEKTGIASPPTIKADPGVQFDVLYRNDAPAFIALQNIEKETATATLNGTWKGCFSGKTGGSITLDPGETDLFTTTPQLNT